ncbi:MAG TPA: L-rhamnose mutarotase [Candidatus Dormibacteraeota bacterium]|nr:L-rhamnose mutarotase [Candidatus Dormibacteraeota bacterium]
MQMQRIAFVMRVKAGQEEEYRRRHRAVWPEMLGALERAGCTNYSIFQRGQDLFAYLEVADFDRMRRELAASDASRRWEAYMAPIMEQGIQPETGFHELLPEVFHLA